jgi:hypothetical protein
MTSRRFHIYLQWRVASARGDGRCSRCKMVISRISAQRSYISTLEYKQQRTTSTRYVDRSSYLYTTNWYVRP